MTRALIADPELLHKTTSGRADEVIECVGCNQSCIGHYHAGIPIGCAVNPRTGRERTLAPAAKREPGRSVLVIGGGPAGVAAALEAAIGRRRRHARRARARARRPVAARGVRTGAPGAVGSLPPVHAAPPAGRGGRRRAPGRRGRKARRRLRRRGARHRGAAVPAPATAGPTLPRAPSVGGDPGPARSADRR